MSCSQALRIPIVVAVLALTVAVPARAVASAPVNTALPTISGTPQVDQTLTATTGTWTGSPTSFDYQWQRCETAAAVWEVQASAADNSWRSVTWGGLPGQERFVAVAQTGSSNRVMTSPDGMTWTSWASTNTNTTWISVDWGGPAGQETFVAVAWNGPAGVDRVMTSPDGTTWTSRTAPTSAWTSVVWGGPAGQEQFVAVARGGTDQVMTSPDGVTWTARTAAAAYEWRSVAWGGPPGQEVFAAVARTGTGDRVMTSPDGITWTLGTTPADVDWRSVTWGGPAGEEKFVAVGRNSTADQLVMTSPDGTTWTLQEAAAAEAWEGVTWGGPAGQEQFVAVGGGTAGDLVMTSPDGVDWTLRTSVGGTLWQAVTWGGPAGSEKFVAVGGDGTGNRVMTNANPACTDITGATASTYVAQDADGDRFLRVAVTASNGTTPNPVAYSALSGSVVPLPALTVTAAGTGSGVVTSSPTGIDCGATCSHRFTEGDAVTLTASAATGSTFDGWGGACSGTGTCTVTMSQARSVTATFTAVAPDPGPNPAPSAEVTIASARAIKNNRILTRIRVDEAGRIRVAGSYAIGSRRARVRACVVRRSVTRAGIYRVACRLNARTRARLATRSLRITLRVTLTTESGQSATTTRTIRVKRYTPRPRPVTG